MNACSGRLPMKSIVRCSQRLDHSNGGGGLVHGRQTNYRGSSGGLAKSSSPYVKIAAMHAVLRALGANFRNNSLFGSDLFNRASKTGGTISYHYALAVPRVGVLALPGDAWFIGSLKGPTPSGSSAASHRQGQVYFLRLVPKSIRSIPRPCPLARTDLMPARPAGRVGGVLCRSALGPAALIFLRTSVGSS